ncbi:collagen alpha-1(X) chain-like [Scomber scombrus]|uniref:Collagen alpha-1(X) chain-like n=1 Tax=Scomber scombrus TaxID=13677 RepID=A0AAV1PV27_SCOSC
MINLCAQRQSTTCQGSQIQIPLNLRMAKLSVILLMCLLAGLSDGQAESNKVEAITDQTDEGLAEIDDNQNFKQRQETAILTSNTTATQESCESRIYMMWKELGALTERLEATMRALDETNRKLEASENQLAQLSNTVTEMSTVDRGQPRVAFSAALPLHGTIGPTSALYPLVYQHIVSNIGNAYSTITGYFTAPVPGVYYFSFTSFWWGGRGSSFGSLYRNGHQVVSWYGNSDTHATSGSNSAILQLQAGDKINVRLSSDRVISDNGNKYSTFSGFLLFPTF